MLEFIWNLISFPFSLVFNIFSGAWNILMWIIFLPINLILGTGKLFLGIFAGVLFFFHPGNVNSTSSTIPSTPVASFNSVAVENTTISKPTNDTATLALTSSIKPDNKYSEPIQEIQHVLQTLDPDESLIVGVKRGDIPQIAVFTVSRQWYYIPYEIRLKFAQTLQESWAYIYSPKDPDKAMIKILDESGNRLGGSKLAGSLVDVNH